MLDLLLWSQEQAQSHLKKSALRQKCCHEPSVAVLDWLPLSYGMDAPTLNGIDVPKCRSLVAVHLNARSDGFSCNHVYREQA
jgi:hypothetical protein